MATGSVADTVAGVADAESAIPVSRVPAGVAGTAAGAGDEEPVAAGSAVCGAKTAS